MDFEVKHAVKWMVKMNEKIQEHKDELSSLDRKIGDGDHGINMARGFQEVEKALKEKEFEGVPQVLKKVAMTVMSKVGGASGPLYGTAFLKMSTALKSPSVDADELADMMQAATDGIKQRGKAVEGEKTMIDVWSPVVESFKSSEGFDASRLREAAESAMEATRDMVATKGRASYLKERSKGHLDPGAVSSFYLFESLAEVIEEEG